MSEELRKTLDVLAQRLDQPLAHVRETFQRQTSIDAILHGGALVLGLLLLALGVWLLRKEKGWNDTELEALVVVGGVSALGVGLVVVLLNTWPTVTALLNPEFYWLWCLTR